MSLINDKQGRYITSDYKMIKIVLVFWAVMLITYVVVVAMLNIELITAPVASVIATIAGLLSIVVAFYQWSRKD